MQNMPRHDPVPRRPESSALAWSRYRSMMKWMALASAVAAALAVAWLKATSVSMPWPMVLAAVAGVGLSVLLGTALMGLVFLSDRTGHDEGAHRNAMSMGTRDRAASGRESGR
ncbi:MAG TPA: hypothetical protein VEA61_01730 [Allosphingosinicella sp.]|nr:hypothetical protein [Allosphingosinicella sp.]